ALVLSSFSPILVLKGRFKSNKYGLALRNGLVVFQFVISIVLIVAAIIVNQQMKYMLGEKLGFKKDNVIEIERADLLNTQSEAFKTELTKIPGVEMVSGTSAMPGMQNFFGVSFQQVNSNESVTGRGIVVDDNFARTIALELKEGRFFSKDFGTDSLSLILNEKAVEEFGLLHPLGTLLTTPDNNLNTPGGKPYRYTVVGVVKDFHFQSLHQKITPLIFINSAKFKNTANVFAVRVKADHINNTLTGIEGQWKKFVKNKPFHFSFLDQTLADQYEAEQITLRLFTVFSSLAILIACIGLLGLVAYTSQQRIREISIRKVLGATSFKIAGMLSKDFLRPVLISSLIGFPVAWLVMHQWLQNFAYRVGISWWVFGLAGLLSVSIALLTISFQSVKAAISKPVKNLRSE
ncbi:MAG TPA: FtsX-like permease family protein, partial [Flavisolibacter sp.]|nr:FtsX-like permease family protein [Flavisolibacter sp.]